MFSLSDLKTAIEACLSSAVVNIDTALPLHEQLALRTLMHGKPRAAGRPALPHGQPPARGTMGTASVGYIADPRTGSLVRAEFKDASRRKFHRLMAANGRLIDAAARGCRVGKPDFAKQKASEQAAARRRAARARARNAVGG